MAADDAQKLQKAGEKQWGTDESMFNMILATRSFAQLRLMFHQYEQLTGHSFEKAILREFSGDVETGMLAVVKSAKSRAAYFAERIHESVAGMGTKDEDLIFLVVTRADVDLESVKNEHLKMYGKSMVDAVKGDTTGDYQKMLLALLGV
jgi:annexin A7/11